MSVYLDWKPTVLGKVIGDGECVALVVNTPQSYVEALYPGIKWQTIIPSVPSAKDLFGDANEAYFQTITNDHANVYQLPLQGDIMVFGATPAAGYTNNFVNPDGHCGVCDSATPTGYTLLQQNSPSSGSPANLKEYPWNFRPCLGWLRPVSTPTPTPPVPQGQTIFLPKTTGPWHLYKVGGPYNPNVKADVKGILYPSKFPPGLTYAIVNNRGNGVYTINTQDFGQGDLWTNGSDVTIS